MDAPQQPRPRATPAIDAPVPVAPVQGIPARHVHRERDFGIGYGNSNSSGYACGCHYTDGHADPLFRCC